MILATMLGLRGLLLWVSFSMPFASRYSLMYETHSSVLPSGWAELSWTSPEQRLATSSRASSASFDILSSFFFRFNYAWAAPLF